MRTVATFDKNPRTTVEIDIPDDVEPLDHVAHVIAQNLGLLRFEVQIGNHGGSIRSIGDSGRGLSFTLTPNLKDS
jgi:hypothetical protein